MLTIRPTKNTNICFDFNLNEANFMFFNLLQKEILIKLRGKLPGQRRMLLF